MKSYLPLFMLAGFVLSSCTTNDFTCKDGDYFHSKHPNSVFLKFDKETQIELGCNEKVDK